MSSHRGSDIFHNLLIVVIILLAPLILLFIGPLLIAFAKLDAMHVHPGLIVLALIALAVLAFFIFVSILAYMPQFVLFVFGFLLYGVFGYHFGSDQIWKMTLGILAGFVGAILMTVMGGAVKRP